MNNKNRKILFLAITMTMFFIALLIGPLDFFTHGYYCDEIDLDSASQDIGIPASLNDGEIMVRFTPIKEHFAGFEIFMTGQAVDDAGYFVYSIEDETGRKIESSSIGLSSVKENAWYKVYADASCKAGRQYLLRMHAEGAEGLPVLATIDPWYLGGEVLEGNTAISFAYRKSTFDAATKTIITIFLLAAWLFIFGILFQGTERKKNVASRLAIFCFLTALLAWNYTFNTFNGSNTNFSSFPDISDHLVTSSIIADEKGYETEAHGGLKYGMLEYQTVSGRQYPFGGKPFLSDANWNEGYSRTEPDILLSSCAYTRRILPTAKNVRFASGDEFEIKSYEDDGRYMRLHLSSPSAFNPERYGDLEDLRFVDQDGKLLESGLAMSYTSQFGLQGKFFHMIARLLGGQKSIPILFLLAALTTALTLVTLSFLLQIKFGFLYAGISYVVFFVSPWVVNFARSLYWVEFTWFIPMIIGLFCSIRPKHRRRRIACYVAACISIMVKSLCGYEYLSSVMLGLIAFPLVEFLIAFIDRDVKKAKEYFRINFFFGVSALMGFFFAVCLHAVLRGEGNLAAGIVSIIQNDVLRRTNGGSLNDFDVVLWDSLNASYWETLCKYFHFSTEIIAGVTGELFPALCCIPILLFFLDSRIGKLDKRLPILYGVFFCVSVSWFVLAKAHSYIHTHLSYVLWYFGFVQVCLYTIARWIVRFIKNKEKPV